MSIPYYLPGRLLPRRRRHRSHHGRRLRFLVLNLHQRRPHLLIHPLIHTLRHQTPYPPRLLPLLLVKDRTDRVHPQPPCVHQLLQLLAHMQFQLVVWVQTQRRRTRHEYRRRYRQPAVATPAAVIHVVLKVIGMFRSRRVVQFLLLLLRVLRGVLLLQLRIERGDVAVDGIAPVEVLLVPEPIKCDGDETLFAGLVRRYDGAQLLLGVSQSSCDGVVYFIRKVGLSNQRSCQQQN